MKRFSILFLLFLLIVWAFDCPAQENTDTVATGNKFHIGFSGILPMGVATTALRNAVSYNSSYGFGLIIEYGITDDIGFFLDGNTYSYNIKQADQGGYAQSIWTVEQYTLTGDGAMNAGPFQTDVRFFMQSTGFRLGVKYYFKGNSLSPWLGAAGGYYAWIANYANSARDKTYGNDNGYLFGYSLLAGVDFKIMDMTLTFFGDFASPVARPEIKDLFYSGWTWSYSNHIMGPTRIGITLCFQ